MPAQFLHGIEIIENLSGPVPITVVKSAVVGLVGSAPFWAAPNEVPLYQLNSLVAVGDEAYDSNGALQEVTSINLPGWVTDTVTAYGKVIKDSNGNTQMCVIAGTTVSSAPTWKTVVGETVAEVDGPTWMCIAIGIAAITDGTAPTWETTKGSTTSDGAGSTITWTLQALNSMPVNLPTLVSSPAQAINFFGPAIQGYSIPYALSFIFAQTAPNRPGSGGATGGPVIAVNVCNPWTHETTVAQGAMSMPASGPQVINLGHMGVYGVLVQNSGKSVTYYEGVDYTLDPVNGLITALSTGNISEGEALQIGYSYCDPSKIVDADLAGTISAGRYTGMQGFLTCYGTMGFFPKLLIAPAASPTIGQTVGSQDASVSSAMETLAGTIRAVAFVDSPALTQVATAIANRGSLGNTFDVNSDRVALCFPWQLAADAGIVPTGVTLNSSGQPIQNLANVNSDFPFSIFVAGATSANDNVVGYWWSPSNVELVGVLGPDVTMYTAPNSAGSDPNNLNEEGIVTINGYFASGALVWGDRSSAFPDDTAPNNFIAVRRVLDVLEESVQLSMMQFTDAPISNGLINSILASANAFVLTLVQRGALLSGSSASYQPAENPSTQIAAGQIVFDLKVAPPTPAERITFNVTLDSTLYGNLAATAQAA